MALFDDSGSIMAPSGSAAAIAPNDLTDLPTPTRGIYVGTGGNLSLILADDTTAVLHKNVPSGSYLPVRVKRVRATGTTATDLVGWS